MSKCFNCGFTVGLVTRIGVDLCQNCADIYDKITKEQQQFVINDSNPNQQLADPYKKVFGLKDNDPVNHPAHYTKGKIEVIDFIEDQDLPYHLSSAIKYICRCKYKGKEKEDLEKAIWYIKRYIEVFKKL